MYLTEVKVMNLIIKVSYTRFDVLNELISFSFVFFSYLNTSLLGLQYAECQQLTEDGSCLLFYTCFLNLFTSGISWPNYDTKWNNSTAKQWRIPNDYNETSINIIWDNWNTWNDWHLLLIQYISYEQSINITCWVNTFALFRIKREGSQTWHTKIRSSNSVVINFITSISPFRSSLH